MTKNKNNNKNNNKKKNNNKQRKANVKRRAPRPGVPQALVTQVCAITDPFCAAAWGAKFPDGRSAKSLAFNNRSRVTLTSDAGGNAGSIFTPSYSAVYATPSGLTTTTASYTTYSGLMVPSYSTAALAGYRINSMGLRIKNMTAPLESSGILRIRGLGALYGTSFGSIDSSNYNYDFSEDIPIQDCHDVCIVFRKLDERSELFVNPAITNPTANVVDWISPGWGAVSIQAVGTKQSAGILDLELYVNYEIIFVDSDSNAMIMSKAKPANALLTNASAFVTNAMNPVIERGIKAVEKTIADKAWSFLARGIGAAAGYAAGGSSGAIMGYQGGALLADGSIMVD